MKVSIFTPTHNTKYLERVFNSLKKQTYQNWEWIIVPNNGAAVDLKDERIKLFPCEYKNIGQLKNFACSKSTGEILFEMDHDDELFPTALEECVKAFEFNQVDFVYSNSCDVKDNYKPIIFSSDFGWMSRTCNFESKQLIETVSFPAGPSSFSKIWYAPNHFRAWKTSFYKKIGGHDVSMEILDDQDILCRTYIQGKIYHLDKPLYVYHVHSEGTAYKERKKIEKATLNLHDKYICDMVKKWCKDRALQNIICDFDVNKKWPFKKNSVGAFTLFGEVSSFQSKEAYRCLAPEGWFFIKNSNKIIDTFKFQVNRYIDLGADLFKMGNRTPN